MSRVVQTRHTGGALTVGVQEAKWSGDTSVIALVAPAGVLDLAPDEARFLAVALIEAAAEAERGHDNWPDE